MELDGHGGVEWETGYGTSTHCKICHDCEIYRNDPGEGHLHTSSARQNYLYGIQIYLSVAGYINCGARRSPVIAPWPLPSHRQAMLQSPRMGDSVRVPYLARDCIVFVFARVVAPTVWVSIPRSNNPLSRRWGSWQYPCPGGMCTIGRKWTDSHMLAGENKYVSM